MSGCDPDGDAGGGTVTGETGTCPRTGSRRAGISTALPEDSIGTESRGAGSSKGFRTGSAMRASFGIFSVERSISGSMERISSSIGRVLGVLITTGAGADCTGAGAGAKTSGAFAGSGSWEAGTSTAGAGSGAGAGGIRVTEEPHRLQKRDSAGMRFPHLEQNTVAGTEATG